MSKTSLEDSYMALFKFMLLSKRRVVEMGTRHGLTGMQTLMILHLDCPRPMSAFSKIFNCDASNITGLVDSLEGKNLVMRAEDPDDRRVKTVQLTAHGKKLRSHLFKHIDTQENPVFSKLEPEELETFITLLHKLTHD